MKFFNPLDFANINILELNQSWANIAANIANAKLEKEGKIVYGCGPSEEGPWSSNWELPPDTHKALLINVRPIK